MPLYPLLPLSLAERDYAAAFSLLSGLCITQKKRVFEATLFARPFFFRLAEY